MEHALGSEQSNCRLYSENFIIECSICTHNLYSVVTL